MILCCLVVDTIFCTRPAQCAVLVLRSGFLYFQWPMSSRTLSLCDWPTIIDGRKPSSATSRRPSAMYWKNVTTSSTRPVETLTKSFCLCCDTNRTCILVSTCTIMIQPSTTRAAVATPHSSAPSNVATARSRGVFIWPSDWTTIRLRRPFFSVAFGAFPLELIPKADLCDG